VNLSHDEAPDALTLIHTDHEEVSALFKTALDENTTSAAKRAAIAKICFALTVHANMEEAIFYPALRKAGKSKEKDSVLEAAEEHACVKELVAKIKRIKGRDETLDRESYGAERTRRASRHGGRIRNLR
jgi:hemerythrin superfamily protein